MRAFSRFPKGPRSAVYSLICLIAGGCLAFGQETGTASGAGFIAPLDKACNLISDGKTKLASDGVTLFFDYQADILGNPVGGKSQGMAYMQMMTFGGEVDLGKTIGWQGGYLDVSAAELAGSNLSDKIGNFFLVAQTYLTNTFLMGNLFLRQTFMDNKIEVCVGRMAAGSYFATLPAFALQVNSGVDANPTPLIVNTPFTSAPDTTWGAYAKYQPTSTIQVQSGIFQANTRFANPNYHGIDYSIRPDDGFMMLDEVDWSPTFGATAAKTDGKATIPADPGLPGVYQAGGYWSNFTFYNFQGGTQHNAYGFYLQGQQMVWHAHTDTNISLSLWGGVTYSPQYQFSIMPVMGYTGLIWQGPVPTRDQDQLLFTYLIGGFSTDYAASVTASGGPRPSAENVLELSYIIQVNTNIQVQPDVQYIIQPAGTSTIPNALVIGFQLSASF